MSTPIPEGWRVEWDANPKCVYFQVPYGRTLPRLDAPPRPCVPLRRSRGGAVTVPVPEPESEQP